MALRSVPAQWRQQPPGPTPLNPDAVAELGICGGFVPWAEGGFRQLDGKPFTYLSVASALQYEHARFGRAWARGESITGTSRDVQFSTGSPNTRSFTFAARVKVATGISGVLMRFGGSDNTLIPLWRNAGAFDMRVGGTDYTQAGTWSENVWYDIEIVGTASSCILYVDGAVVINGAAAASQTITSLIDIKDISGSGDLSFGYCVFANRPWSEAKRREFRANPWQVFQPRRIWVPISAGGGTIYTINPTGTIEFNGSSTFIKEKTYIPSGNITFDGGITNFILEKTIVPSGQIEFSGTNTITFTSGGTTYTINPSGLIEFTGTNTLTTDRVLLPSGLIDFSGQALYTKEQTYSISGDITFSGTAGVIFVPFGTPEVSTYRPLTGAGK